MMSSSDVAEYPLSQKTDCIVSNISVRSKLAGRPMHESVADDDQAVQIEKYLLTVRSTCDMLAGAGRQRRIRASVDLRNSMSQLKDKVAVISGGTSGIGLAIVGRFVQEAARVFNFGPRRGALEEGCAS